MKQFSLLFSLLFSLNTFAQDINNAAEIFMIMEKSTLLYEINASDEKMDMPDYSRRLNFNTVYLDAEGLKEYELNEKATELFKEAETFFQAGNYAKAREKYLATLKEAPKFYKIMTYIGQTYGQEGEDEKAIEWYRKTISKNPIDYMAHWFLADACFLLGRMEVALDEITIAQVLNRNNPRIKQSFDRIYKTVKLKSKDWTFNPQASADSVAPNKISISYSDPKWLGYGLAKAVWKFEPGYSEERGVAKGTFSTTEERECLYSLYVGLKKKDFRKNPTFKAMQMAVEQKRFDEYILYEILLVQHPYAVYQLSEKTIARIKDYVINVRGKLK